MRTEAPANQTIVNISVEFTVGLHTFDCTVAHSGHQRTNEVWTLRIDSMAVILWKIYKIMQWKCKTYLFAWCENTVLMRQYLHIVTGPLITQMNI